MLKSGVTHGGHYYTRITILWLQIVIVTILQCNRCHYFNMQTNIRQAKGSLQEALQSLQEALQIYRHI